MTVYATANHVSAGFRLICPYIWLSEPAGMWRKIAQYHNVSYLKNVFFNPEGFDLIFLTFFWKLKSWNLKIFELFPTLPSLFTKITAPISTIFRFWMRDAEFYLAFKFESLLWRLGFSFDDQKFVFPRFSSFWTFCEVSNFLFVLKEGQIFSGPVILSVYCSRKKFGSDWIEVSPSFQAGSSGIFLTFKKKKKKSKNKKRSFKVLKR